MFLARDCSPSIWARRNSSLRPAPDSMAWRLRWRARCLEWRRRSSWGRSMWLVKMSMFIR
jgi:hypothetical protein